MHNSLCRPSSGICTALVAGCIFGFQFVPITYLKLCDDTEHSCEDLDYLFGYYTGIMAGSTVSLALYCAYMNNKPRIYPGAILPGVIAGIMWGVGSGMDRPHPHVHDVFLLLLLLLLCSWCVLSKQASLPGSQYPFHYDCKSQCPGI